jgi:hypothetical protein
VLVLGPINLYQGEVMAYKLMHTHSRDILNAMKNMRRALHDIDNESATREIVKAIHLEVSKLQLYLSVEDEKDWINH